MTFKYQKITIQCNFVVHPTPTCSFILLPISIEKYLHNNGYVSNSDRFSGNLDFFFELAHFTYFDFYTTILLYGLHIMLSNVKLVHY